MLAVTTTLREWRWAEIVPQISISCKTLSPKQFQEGSRHSGKRSQPYSSGTLPVDVVLICEVVP